MVRGCSRGCVILCWYVCMYAVWGCSGMWHMCCSECGVNVDVNGFDSGECCMYEVYWCPTQVLYFMHRNHCVTVAIDIMV